MVYPESGNHQLRETRHQEEEELRNELQQDNSIEGIQYILLFYYYIYEQFYVNYNKNCS